MRFRVLIFSVRDFSSFSLGNENIKRQKTQRQRRVQFFTSNHGRGNRDDKREISVFGRKN